MLLNANGRSLHRHIAHLLIGKSTQLTLQQHRIRGGHARGRQGRDHTGAQGTDHGASVMTLQMIQGLGQPPGAGGFTVGPGHRNQTQALAGRNVKRIRTPAGMRFELVVTSDVR